MELSNEDMEKLVAQQNEYMDARAAELLNHDPELIEIYHQDKLWKTGAKDLLGQLIAIIESDQLALLLRNSIGTHKNVAVRIREVSPDAFIRQGLASDCIEAIEVASEKLRLLAGEIRRQISELPSLDRYNAEQLKRVDKASFKAMIESFRMYAPIDKKDKRFRGFKYKRDRLHSRSKGSDRPST